MCKLLQLVHHTLPAVSLQHGLYTESEKTADHDLYLSHNMKQPSQSETNQLPSQQRQSLVSEQGYLATKWQPTFLSKLQPRLKTSVESEQTQTRRWLEKTLLSYATSLTNRSKMKGGPPNLVRRPIAGHQLGLCPPCNLMLENVWMKRKFLAHLKEFLQYLSENIVCIHCKFKTKHTELMQSLSSNS